jgi:PhnB protein
MAKDAPAEWQQKIMHARLAVGDTELLGADALPGTYESPRGFSILISPSTPAEADSVFHTLAANGIVGMPLQETFWTSRFGVVTDEFGITWTINCEKAA